MGYFFPQSRNYKRAQKHFLNLQTPQHLPHVSVFFNGCKPLKRSTCIYRKLPHTVLLNPAPVWLLLIRTTATCTNCPGHRQAPLSAGPSRTPERLLSAPGVHPTPSFSNPDYVKQPRITQKYHLFTPRLLPTGSPGTREQDSARCASPPAAELPSVFRLRDRPQLPTARPLSPHTRARDHPLLRRAGTIRQPFPGP